MHELPNTGKDNANWLTPPWLLKLLGHFDLDPCCHVDMPWRTADTMFCLPEHDGLLLSWAGRVFLNPPYGSQTKLWTQRMAEHGNGIALLPARTEVESWFWPHIWEAANSVFFLRGRLYYHRLDGHCAATPGTDQCLLLTEERTATSCVVCVSRDGGSI